MYTHACTLAIVFDKILKKAASMRPQKEKPKGRIGLKGVPRVEKQFCKKSYKIEFKLSVLAYWNDSTVDHTLRKFWPEIEGSAAIDTKRKMLYAWKKNLSQVQDVPRAVSKACYIYDFMAFYFNLRQLMKLN